MADIQCAKVLGSPAVEAMRRAGGFLSERSTAELLESVGRTFPELALAEGAPDKHSFPAGYGGGKPCEDDLLAGAGMFYVTQNGKLMLDCTSGHYQMTWGYNHPALTDAAIGAMRLGVIWDNHSNIPGLPVKLLADRLTELGGPLGLDRVLLGVCTGSVACSTALKVMLMRYGRDAERVALGPPVMIALAGNYHGTDMVAQTMRGMWPGLVSGMDTIQLEPNDGRALRAAFERFGRRVAGFWAEPVMMNREALLVDPEYLRLARELCDEHGALMAIDEIQTGFWYPEVLMARELGVSPDFVIIGKGMTAGFHPLSGVLYRAELDILEQYDSISTNGGASLAAFVGLCNLRLIAGDADRLAALAERHIEGLRALADEFAGLVEAVNGAGFLTGLKFSDREDAIGFQRSAVARGLWLRVHAYHPGHRTVLMKYPLVVDEAVIDYVLGALRELLSTTPWRG
jgi:acetylornithine/succinyldiaminopimelate/putrescine aminotransferase